MATWSGFALVAVLVVAGTSAWAASLSGPGGGQQAAAPSLANVPTVAQTTPPPTPVEPAHTAEAPAPPTTQLRVTRAPVTTVVPTPVAPPPGPLVPPPVVPPPVTTTAAPTTAPQPIRLGDEPPTCNPGETNKPRGCTPAPNDSTEN